MTTSDEAAITQLAAVNPVPQTAAPTAEERAEAERLLQRVLHDEPSRRVRRRHSGILASAVSLLVVLAVVAVALRTGGSSTTGSHGNGDVRITLRAEPTPQTPRITPAVMSREMALLRHRLASLGHGFTVRQSGVAGIVVTVPKAKESERARIVQLLRPNAQLRFFDWEANVLTPNGRTVASQLPTQDHTAVALSQGTSHGAGFAGAGSSSLYDAVRLAATQPRRPLSPFQSRVGPEYYLFGRPGSAACAAAAARDGTAPAPGTHCLLAGPLDAGNAVSRARAIGELAAQLPVGVAPSQGQVLVVPQGTFVVQAQQLHSVAPVSFSSPGAQFFVVRDRVALFGADVTHPRASTDAGGMPSVTFNFTGAGRAAFQQVTRVIAHRGANVSRAGLTLDQHFAVALDDQLVTVPSISFEQYPDGVVGANSADITGGLTAATAHDLAAQLRYGVLPLGLRVVS